MVLPWSPADPPVMTVGPIVSPPVSQHCIGIPSTCTLGFPPAIPALVPPSVNVTLHSVLWSWVTESIPEWHPFSVKSPGMPFGIHTD